MTCSEFHNLYSDYRDGALDWRTARLCERHLRRCPRCSRFNSILNGSIELMRQESGVDPSPWFRPRLQSRLETERVRARSAAAFPANAGLAAGLLFAAALGVLAYDVYVSRPPVAVAESAAPQPLAAAEAAEPEAMDFDAAIFTLQRSAEEEPRFTSSGAPYAVLVRTF